MNQTEAESVGIGLTLRPGGEGGIRGNLLAGGAAREQAQQQRRARLEPDKTHLDQRALDLVERRRREP